ncbi:hypothetical protein CAPTEDRAFT_212322 [Capitella teleta]|uniref:Cytochrome P450 n=1 Tax=Capitella teleta TaxID=283909 RepID=R7T7Y6_CAPTE|nr:hypothetical protein CAPTEDRAFT_212322 [Capitella teleta]|eukprot:ELT89563.1 hypothetical protein CAPTEDRAFT_212322 [Capitella teleta]
MLLTFLTPVLTPVILFLVSCRLWTMYCDGQRDKNSPLPLPPGNMGLPFIGETLNFLIWMRDFSQFRRKVHGDVFKTHILGRPTIRVIGAENVHRILNGEHCLVAALWPTSAQTLLGAGSLSMSHGHVHKQRRKILLRAFSHQALKSYMEECQHIIRSHVIKWCGLGSIKAYPEIKRLTFAVVCRVILGFDLSEKDQDDVLKVFIPFSSNMFSVPLNIPGSGYYRVSVYTSLYRMLYAYSYTNYSGLVGSDALSLVLQHGAAEGEAISDDNLKDLALELLFAGYETTASAACSTVNLLASNQHVLKKAYTEICHNGLDNLDEPLAFESLGQLEYINNIVKEVLRLLPPIGGGFRKSLKTFELDGYQIPKDWCVVYSIRETHEDTFINDNNKDFDPDRWQRVENGDASNVKDFLPFGSGSRSCAGKDFARLLLKVLVTELVRNCSWDLLEGDTPAMEYFPVPHPKNGLPTQFTGNSKFRLSSNTC